MSGRVRQRGTQRVTSTGTVLSLVTAEGQRKMAELDRIARNGVGPYPPTELFGLRTDTSMRLADAPPLNEADFKRGLSRLGLGPQLKLVRPLRPPTPKPVTVRPMTPHEQRMYEEFGEADAALEAMNADMEARRLRAWRAQQPCICGTRRMCESCQARAAMFSSRSES